MKARFKRPLLRYRTLAVYVTPGGTRRSVCLRVEARDDAEAAEISNRMLHFDRRREIGRVEELDIKCVGVVT